MKHRNLRGIALVIWLVNFAACLGLAAFLINGQPDAGRNASLPVENPGLNQNQMGKTPYATITPIPPPTQRATITPFPTPTTGASVTPLPDPPANRRVIGYSVEGRPLEVFRYGRGERIKLIVAGIHGGYEWNTVALANELIQYLDSQPQIVPNDTTLYILRNLNPDGYARAHDVDGRGNANGVDLNHNWPYRWAPTWSRDGCWKFRMLTGGSYAGSEPEVAALIAFIDKIQPEALISYHSAALGVFPGGIPEFGPSVQLANEIARVTTYPYPPIETGCDFTGNLADWASNTRSIPAVDIELANHENTDFEDNLRVLQVFLAWRP